MEKVQIAQKTVKVFNGHGLVQIAPCAESLTRVMTDPPADGGEGVVGFKEF